MADREVTYSIIERIAVLTDGNNGWRKEVNLVSWNGGPAKIDIRDWSPDHERMTRGITLPEDAAEKLAVALAERYKIGE